MNTYIYLSYLKYFLWIGLFLPVSPKLPAVYTLITVKRVWQQNKKDRSSSLIEISGTLSFAPQIQAALTERKAPLLKETSEILKGFYDPSLPHLFLSKAVQYRNEIAKGK